ncbi:glyoxalase [Xanthomonas arboricola pv. juglandis]|nr:glyoxalase [Xanthomonas arboricola]CAG2085757.1 glyoxalase [Xanthomonas arboricola pv. juglandis]
MAALQHGGSCNGAPGLRPDYGDGYYAAFVIDPDGHHLEAVVNTTV